MKKDYLQSGRSKQKQKTRNSILKAAQNFLSEGKEFSLEDIAEAIDLSRATVYRYFSSVEILSREAGLDLSTKTPKEIIDQTGSDDLIKSLVGIQKYFNQLTIDHETAFRRYLSVVINAEGKEEKRGARRQKTLTLALKNHDVIWSDQERENLVMVGTALMGIEPFIVMKDVCERTDEQAEELLKWGLEMMIRGIQASYEGKNGE